ncbi:class I SAM-dependent methyltransferase [Natronosalvus halobius]|uniref:class I SAM-dependent methyltransferase n=1 Tax=Natronosalvus halobius TaxID=2953746 RepID=UPI00288054FD|nr:methyltransferase domain-containing protein [Natronosalvus halobius]
MADKNAVRRSYDELAPIYAAQRSDDGPGTGVLERFLDSLEDPRRVLDAGCGQGTPVLSRLAETTTAVGLDFSREQLGLATGNAPEAGHVQGDMTALPLEESSFDAVVAYWSLIHVPLDEHRTVVEEFKRVLRPGGRLLLCEGTNAWTGENLDWLESGVEMSWEIAGAEATRGQLQEAGFAVLEEWGVPEEFANDGEGEGEVEIEDDSEGKDEYGEDSEGKDEYGEDSEGKDEYGEDNDSEGKDEYGEDSEGKDEYGEDNDSEGDGEDEDHPWTFFVARLERT